MLSTWKIKTAAGVAVNLVLLLVMSGVTVSYFVWRQDQPPNNPGGPIGNMGGRYMFWEGMAIYPGPTLSVWAVFNIVRLLRNRSKPHHEKAPATE